MKDKLAVLLWATGPDLPYLCATPFFHAAAAAAMDAEVEIHFSSKSVLLLVRGVAAGLYAGSEPEKSIYDHMRHAYGHGVRFFACTDAVEAHGVDRSNLVPELNGFAGAAAFVGRVLDSDWTTMIF